MITLHFQELATSLSGELNNTGYANASFRGVSIDTRTLVGGQLYVAVRGVNHDGHTFIDDAARGGAAGVLAERSHDHWSKFPASLPVVGVNDTHIALMAMATKYLAATGIRKIGITGSNGKTTTKEMTYALLTAVTTGAYRSPGNLNNLYGLPLSILDMPDDTTVGVFELGISLPDEMGRLATIVQPDVIVITNVGASHLEFLGSVEGVARAKLELVRRAADTVPVVVNADSPVLMAEARKIRSTLTTFGIKNAADYMPEQIETDDSGATHVSIDGHEFVLPLFGHHQVYNLLAAVASVKALGFDFDNVDTKTIALDTVSMRGQIIDVHGVTIVADCYNANPDSMRSGLDSLKAHSTSGRTVIVLGDMLELGEVSTAMHEELGLHLAETPCDLAVVVGPESVNVREAAVTAGMDPDCIRHADNAEQAAGFLVTELRAGDLMFIKGSRGIGLEKIIDRWREAGGRA